MHTTYTKEGGRSLKNTKINYTTDLLHHCLLNLWEDFVILCVCYVVVSPGSLVVLFRGGKKQIIFIALLSAMKCRRSVFSKVKSTVTSPGRQTWFFTKQICLEQPKREEKLMSSFSKDKCFNWYHTDFLLSFKRMQPRPSSTLYIILCSLCLHPPRIHKIDTHTKKKTKKKMSSLSSGWLPVCENM